MRVLFVSQEVSYEPHGIMSLSAVLKQAVNPLRESAGKPPVFSVFGGPHPTFFPEMINEPGVDGVCIGEVAWDHSILVFPSEEDRRQREHLQRLFALGVEFPRLEGLILKLIKLPHNKPVDTIFWWFHKLHRGWTIYFRVYPFRPGPIELVKTALHFMRIKS